MPIAINPSLISKAATYQTALLQASPTRLCSAPPSGSKFVPMQFVAYQNGSLQYPNLCYYVDLSSGAVPVLDQACSIYVDATTSKSAVTVLFADSGYETTVAAGNTALIPILTGTALPKFYVIFGNNALYDSTINPTGGHPGDTANVFVTNFFIPEFNSQNFINTVGAGGYVNSFPPNNGRFSTSFDFQTVASQGIGSYIGMFGGQIFSGGANVNSQAIMTRLNIGGWFYTLDGKVSNMLVQVIAIDSFVLQPVIRSQYNAVVNAIPQNIVLVDEQFSTTLSQIGLAPNIAIKIYVDGVWVKQGGFTNNVAGQMQINAAGGNYAS